MKFPRHSDGESCDGCNKRMSQASDSIAEAFYFIKSNHNEVHCSWVHRGKEDQESAFKSGASRAHFGESKHNLLPSEAMDLFQIIEGKAVFDGVFCAKLNKELIEAGYELKWGGTFRKLGDYGHWETI